MKRRFPFCRDCRRSIMDSEQSEGRYAEDGEAVVCADCAARSGLPLVKDRPAAPPREEAPRATSRPPVPPAQLEEIARTLERIERLLLFERSSVWNVLGTVAQCLAGGMAVVAGLQWHEKPVEILLAALFFQTMALTFYFKGR